MVRLVFRPYTRLRRSICTSESLRTSTRVSPGFVLAGHRSPSFGSQHVRSRCACPVTGKPAPSQTPRGCAAAALDRRRISPQRAQRQAFAFTTPWCLVAPRLAHMLDSLVRVSRRVEWNHNQTRRQLRRAPPNNGRRRQESDTGSARQGTRRAQTTSRAPAPLPALRLTGTPPERSVDRTGARLNPTVGGRTTAHPRGLKRTALREARRAPTCPPHRAPRGDAMSTDREARPQGRTNAS